MIGERIKKLRDEKGMSQAELAKSLNCNRMTINNYETGKRIPDIEFAMNTADYFHVTVEYLSGRTEFRDKDDITISVKKAEELIKTLEKLPQSESQRLLSYLIETLDNAKENGIEEPIIFGLMNAALQLDKLTSGFLDVQKSIVRTVSDLRYSKISESQIRYACTNKSSAIYEYSFDVTKTLTDTIQLCSSDLKKLLEQSMEEAFNENKV